MTPTLRGLGGRGLWRMWPKPVVLSSRRILGAVSLLRRGWWAEKGRERERGGGGCSGEEGGRGVEGWPSGGAQEGHCGQGLGASKDEIG